MTEFAHLDPEARAALHWPLEERIEFAKRDRWIGYARANQALAAMEDLLAHPRTLRMPNLLLVGESGNGKSSIIAKFEERHPIHNQESGDPIATVVCVEMPPEPSESRFWSELLISMFVAHSPKANVQEKENQAMSILSYYQTKMLIVDEIHNLLHGHARAQRQFMTVLKKISNKLKMPLVCAGTRDAIRALHTDPQMVSRFEPLGLPRWSLDTELLRVLMSLERLMPLAEPSDLAGRELATKLHQLSGGTIGGLTKVLKKATVVALLERKERIDLKLLNGLGPLTMDQFAKSAGVL